MGQVLAEFKGRDGGRKNKGVLSNDRVRIGKRKKGEKGKKQLEQGSIHVTVKARRKMWI